MKLNVRDEFSPLKSVVVCYGRSIPDSKDYKTNDPQELKWGWKKWDKDLLLKQQDNFFTKLQKYNVDLIELESEPELIWQMYTRDTGFVVGDMLFYASKRTLKARNGEIKELLNKIQISENKLISLPGKIEGGDVLVSQKSFVGLSNRTNETAVRRLDEIISLKTMYIGDNVMHLDTRLTLLPRNYVLANLETFLKSDQDILLRDFKVLHVSESEAKQLATNVFIVNPDTIFVEKSQKRIQGLLKDAGFKVVSLSYSEPIALGGSFRCTTLPLVRG